MPSRPKLPPPTDAEIDLAIAESVAWFVERGLVFTRHNVMSFASDFRGVPYRYALARCYAHWDKLFGGISYTDRWKVTPAVRDRLQAIGVPLVHPPPRRAKRPPALPVEAA